MLRNLISQYQYIIDELSSPPDMFFKWLNSNFLKILKYLKKDYNQNLYKTGFHMEF